MDKTLIIGYGNVDRQDDGVAWHVLSQLSQRLGRNSSQEPDTEFEPAGFNPDFFFTLQLTPEVAELAARYERVCFVDAHTGRVPEDVHVEHISALYQNSPFTHHMTPETILAFSHTLYATAPRAILVSVRGHQFGFKRSLSPATEMLARQAVTKIEDWLSID